MKEATTGIILAGGKSRRMGMEKGLIEFKGHPLIYNAISLFEKTCTEIIISANSKSYDYLGFKVVHDTMDDSGPMGGIYSCLQQSKNQKNLVLSCDMPFVTELIFEELGRNFEDAWISVPWYKNDHFEPLCGIYSKDSLKDMKVFMKMKNYKLPELFMKTNFKPLNINDIYPPLPAHYFMNINNPEELEIAERISDR
jgi:molybdenum cofactor guanylyltransferase